MVDIKQWLDSFGLGIHADAFERNAIEWDHLADLDHAALKEIGVDLVGHRLTILREISKLNEDAATSPVGASQPTPTAHARHHSGEAERRQLTVIFCDLVGSTSLAARMDPEDYRDVLTAYREAALRAIHRFEGNVANYLGDGLLVYFGYPRAHEDDAERSLRSALDIVNAVGELRPRPDIVLKVRIGIATGLVVVGDIVTAGTADEQAVLGDTPNLAARLQGVAEPGEIVVSEATRKLAKGRFNFEILEPQKLKGIADPVQAYRAISANDADRFNAAAKCARPMAGRAGELAAIEDCWARVKGGGGQVVLLMGEAGIGKSRLAQELQERIAPEASVVLRYQCSPYHTGSAFHPFVEQLLRVADIGQNNPPEVQREKVIALAEQTWPGVALAKPLLTKLLCPQLATGSLLAMSPQKQRSEIIDLLCGHILNTTDCGPALMIFEDAHWVDPSSQQVLDALIEKVRSHRLLCLISCRQDRAPPVADRNDTTVVSLKGLEPRDIDHIIEGVTGGKDLPDAVRREILRKTDGVPLFVEELTKNVLEAGFLQEEDDRYRLVGPLPKMAIPTTLQDSLVARLDRLASVKEVAQIAACIGREFSFELLAQIVPLNQAKLSDALDRLLNAQLIFQHGPDAKTSYAFKHALVQDAAYASLLISKRRQLHANIAEVLVERFPATVAAEPSRIAQHYSAAEMSIEAIPYWLAAGRQALSGSNLSEANAQLTKALAVLGDITDPLRRAEYELDVRTALGATTMALHGWPAEQVRAVIVPACELFEQGYGASDAFMNLWHLWVHHGCRSEHREGLEVIDRMLTHAADRDEPVLSLISAFAASMANLWVGNYDEAARYEEAAIQAYDVDRDKMLVWSYNHDPKNTLLSWGACRVWALGYPDKARVLSDKAVAHARLIAHPFNLCWTLGNSYLAYALSGDFGEARSRIDELLEIAREQELAFMEAYMVPVAIAILANQEGNYETAYQEGMRAEQAWRSIGGRFWSPFVRANMAHACLQLGRIDEASELAGHAIGEMEASRERMMGPEIYRIAGLVAMARRGEHGTAFDLLEKSTTLSRKQGTRAFELRTATSLAAYWRDERDDERAREILLPVCAGFTEGRGTMDFRHAEELLASLSYPTIQSSR